MDSSVVEEYGLSRAQLFHQEYHDHDHDQSQDDLRKGPWTVEEDSLLFNYVSAHGEGRWNSLARHAGLKRTGKSCRLRWLNYLRPSVRRGNITLQEQLLILELHSRWGNRWSKIAQYLPGRTDNEIKNYWRTRVQKQAKQLNCDVNSKQFQDAMRYVWIPRLLERIQSTRPDSPTRPNNYHDDQQTIISDNTDPWSNPSSAGNNKNNNSATEASGSSADTSEAQMSSVSELTECLGPSGPGLAGSGLDDGFFVSSGGGGDSLGTWWSEEDLSFFQQHGFLD